MYGTISHIGNWIDRAEPDFYMMFIKAWIPFNAWYMTNFYDEPSGIVTDRAIINHIKSNDNTFVRRIKSLLRGNDSVSLEFKHALGKLEMDAGNFGQGKDKSYKQRHSKGVRYAISFGRHAKDGFRRFRLFPAHALLMWWKLMMHGLSGVLGLGGNGTGL